ncbi:hypothetical protein Salat_0889500 [Sesamum alatum]|uniref:Uncharacterized protein n=1 Tax=Sesamum alatum TaxID=300844 RepID=A0AAE1YJL2_9LAMI|nr:hypothetical protein Salat_0889500 [Sesamum alatum]
MDEMHTPTMNSTPPAHVNLVCTEQIQKLPTSSLVPQGNSAMLQNQASIVQQQPGDPVAKLPFQLNALRPQDQQNQLLQFQQQQQLQAQFGPTVVCIYICNQVLAVQAM